ncbi:sigma-54-dependent transcriptional regulator [Candidatus Nitrospira nitrificans]|uniref:Acetoacetate metabolism regulatory protein AtoC n=1 Tax=Candidatus Nitrospira nitrificans TaxID=1742973 RepID=A0A0S4LU68_9BACT|nr:sigma-54 dependent transcriptional regulator [Candidatus Nitrospira nitrificans]CUS39531.1 Acetoacetate metabolism regulatory protein AtoC [Candidatus Nitrospira nitrificans]
MAQHPRILVVDDDRDTLSFLREVLSQEGYEVETTKSAKAALGMVAQCRPDLIMSDIHMPELDGLSLLSELRSRRHDMPVILMTAYGSLKTAVDGIQAGAFDYLSKPFMLDDVRLVVHRALEHMQVPPHNQQLKNQLNDRFDGLIGSSPAMVQVYKSIARVSRTDSTVLLQGESGTGKELLARAIHANSNRKTGPFVAVDGGALTETLLESELFGHERGAFTGAVGVKKGLLEKAHLGTCFLDEVADLSATLQGKLLRVIQEREIRRVGSTTPMDVDVRIIAASKKDLSALVKAGTFREDLYYRLNVVTIAIPPLRERMEDVPLLAEHFVQIYGAAKAPQVTGISTDAMTVLTQYWWPGNIRELEHAIERAVALSPHPILCPEDLPLAVRTATVREADHARGWMTVEELVREHIVRVLKHHNGDLGRSSSILGIHRKTLLRKLRQYGLVGGPRTGYPSPDTLSVPAGDERSPLEEQSFEESAYTS